MRLLLVAILLPLTSLAEEPLDFDVSLALDGSSGSASITELRVHALSSTGGQVSVETMGGSPNVQFRFSVSPGLRTSAYAPVGFGLRGEALTIRARINNESWQSKTISRRATSSRLFVVGEQLTHDPTTGTAAIALSGSELPHMLQGYDSVFALAIDATALAELDDDQLRALLDYAGTCGRLLLLDISAAVQNIFASHAACSGDYLRTVKSSAGDTSEFEALIVLPDRSMPSAFQLQQLARSTLGGSTGLINVAKLCFAYLIVLTILLLGSRKPHAVLALAVTTTLLVILIWPREASHDFVAWAEAPFDDDVARYRGFEQHVANRYGSFSLTVERFRNQLANIVGEDYSILWSTNDKTASITWGAKPFQELNRVSTGSFAIEPHLGVLRRDNFITVCNDSEQASRRAYLSWSDSVFEVGPLDPGEIWTSEDKTAIEIEPGLDGSLTLLRHRARNHELAIVVPLKLSNSEGRAWLMRYGDAQVEEAACAT